MSLALGVALEDLIITTSDSAVVHFEMDEEVFKETGQVIASGEMTATDFKSKKTHKISNKVLLAATGYSAITTTLEIELLERADDFTNLQEAREIAQGILRDIKKKNVKYKDKIIDKLMSEIPVSDHLGRPALEDDYYNTIAACLDTPFGLSAYLIGFNEDGTSGLVDIRENNYTESNNKNYPVFLAGDSTGRYSFENYMHLLNFPEEQRTFENFINALVTIHAHISWKRKQVNVSADCTFRIFVKNNDHIDYTEFVIDSSEYYKQLGFKEIV